jgi:hypothetical protein
VHVQEESRTIVVAEEADAGADGGVLGQRESTRKLEPYTATRAEPTVVIRDRRVLRELQQPSAKKRPLSSILLWVAAGLAAFGLGGALAIFTAKDDPEPEPQAATPAPPAPKAEPVVEAELAPQAIIDLDIESGSDVPAVNAAELPVEDEPLKKPPRKPPASSGSAAAPAAPKSAAPKVEIPSGI